MPDNDFDSVREALEAKRAELTTRLERITANVRRGYQADSEERAKEMEDHEVVDALGNEARDELKKITAALERIDTGEYGVCIRCGEQIGAERLSVYPYAQVCIDCAREEELRQSRP